MNIILTGHKGLIGSSLKDRLEKKGCKVTKSFDKRDGSDLRLLSSYKPSEYINLFIYAAAHCKIN